MIIRKTEKVQRVKDKRIGPGAYMSGITVSYTWWFLIIPVYTKTILKDVKIYG
jgi:hypothetical protein